MSLPIGIRTYLITRALGALSREPGELAAEVGLATEVWRVGLATEVCGMADGGVMTGVVIICRTLSTIFMAMDTMAFWVAASMLCTNLLHTPLPDRYPSPLAF